MNESTSSISRLLRGLARFQASKKGAFSLVILSIVLSALSFPLIKQLSLNSSWKALLPAERQSVKDLERIGNRVGGLSTLTLGVQSKDLGALQDFAKDLVPRLEKLDGVGIRSVDYSVTTYERFASEHKYLFASQDDLDEVQEALEDKLDAEMAKANPFFVSLDDDDDDDDDEPTSFDEVIEPLRKREAESKKKMEKYPGGYYVHPDRDFLALFVRSDLKGGDAKGTAKLIDAIKTEISALDTKKYAADLKVDFGGSLVVALEEQMAIVTELAIATGATIVLVLLAILIFFRRFRSVAILGLGLIAPVALTFAAAEVLVDYLNTSTAFLASIVIGNGVNPNIIWLARYFEERREGKDVDDAIKTTQLETWTATLVASSAAALAYGSLIITDFRGFRDFGIIGSIGMVLCWISSIVLLPAWVRFFENIRPMKFKEVKKKESGNLYGRMFSSLAGRFPKSVVWLSILTGLISIAMVVVAIINDPMEYDFRRLKSERKGTTIARLVNRRVGQIMSGAGEGNAIVMVFDSVDDALKMEKALEDNDDKKNYASVRSIFDLLPKDQEEKIETLTEIRRLALKLRKYGDEKEQAEIDKYLPPENIKPVSKEDLPEPVARMFTEKDGTRGRMLFISKNKKANIWNGRFLMNWANELREFSNPDGTKPPLAGRAPVFADIVDEVWESTPKSIGAALLATSLLLLFAFGRFSDKALGLGALLLGIAWMGALMMLLGQRLNFLNILAFPITFGNGVDYGVNVLRRYVQERDAGKEDAIHIAIKQSGGAVVLCSLTTIIGYISLYFSANQAINSFGLAMSISEVTCVLAAMLTLPAVVIWRKKMN